MHPKTQTATIFSRQLKDFLAPSTAEKAGIIELRMGNSTPVQYNEAIAWPPSPPITGLEYDSRTVKPGALYFALPGLHADGHDFIDDAIERGASAIVHQRDLAKYSDKIIYIRVKDSRFAMSPIADSFYNFPSRRMKVIGVTGTQGKSTTTVFIYQLLKLLNKKAGFISTVQQGNGLEVNWNREHQTTPEAPVVHRQLAEMYRNGAEFAILECSSHGLSKKTNRLGDVNFNVGVMTNVTHDHLEFHGTWEQYRSDKAELFRSLNSFGVVNADDQSAVYFSAATKRNTCSFSTKGAEADLSLQKIESDADGNSYEVLLSSPGTTITIKDKLPGTFNAGNVLAALLVVSNLLSIEIEDMVPLVMLLEPVRGRMTNVYRGQPFEVLVDYAHTPASFEAVLPPLRERLNSMGGRLICLFGSAGERDTQKRKTQGEIAARYSDTVFLADEDPRSEEPMAILEEIAKGCEKMTRGETLFLIPNRGEAIRQAFSIAQKGDMVLLLGKGHENSIIYADKTIDYDEITEAETALKEAGYRKKKHRRNKTEAGKYPRIKNAVLLCILLTVIQSVLGVIVGIVNDLLGYETGSAFSNTAIILIQIISFATVIFIGFRKTGRKFNDVFRFNKVSPDYWLAIIIFMFGYVILASEFDNILEYILPMPQFLQDTFESMMVDQAFIGTIILIVIIPTITEEMLFRGLMISGFRENYSEKKTIIVSALLFGMIHLNPWQFASAFIIGIIMAWLFLKTGSILLCMYMHFFNNLFSVLIENYGSFIPIKGFIAANTDEFSFQPLWLNGFGIVLTIFGILLLRRSVKKE
ncbi:MAG: UDP-N-acetylmuramoyl-L-alanyl-D-glutamate--2,6-diaminopimelate ligase [Treponema sp.]|nr:UDP-N-acetylmuramoyl-L-alanyl-D-glutamate--2,6-diaminopimelate ligase [Treponema sp.]